MKDSIVTLMKQYEVLSTEYADLYKKTQEIKEKMDVVEEKITQKMLEDGVTSTVVKGCPYRATLKHSVVPTIENWEETLKWVLKGCRYEFLPKKINTLVWREALETGIEVPGTTPFDRYSLSFTKMKGGENVQGNNTKNALFGETK